MKQYWGFISLFVGMSFTIGVFTGNTYYERPQMIYINQRITPPNPAIGSYKNLGFFRLDPRSEGKCLDVYIPFYCKSSLDCDIPIEIVVERAACSDMWKKMNP